MTKRLAAVLALVALASACVRAKPPAPARTPAGTPPPGTVRLGYPAEPPTLDPLAPGGASAATRDVLRPVLPALFRLDEKLRPQPELARSWPGAGDFAFEPFSVVVRLRQARWSDGTPITAHDVRFSWERLRDGPTRSRYRFLRDVVVTSSRTVRLVFDRPVRRWWALFSIDDMVLPRHAYGPAWAGGPTVAGGPYAFDGWTRGLSVRLKRNASYWGEPARADAIEVVVVPEDETRLQLLESGDVDALYAPGDANMGARLRARGFSEPDGGRGASGAWGSFWWELDLLRDRVPAAVLEAVRVAVDRSLAAEVLEDAAQLMHGIPARFPAPGPSAFGLPPVNGPWSALAGDLEAARQILRKAGFHRDGDVLKDPKGKAVELKLAYASGPATAPALARLLHFRMRELGIRFELIGVDADRFESDWLPSLLADGYVLLRRGADAPDPGPYRSDTASPGRSPGADEAIDRAESGVDPARLARGPVTGLSGAWNAAQEAILAGGAVLPLVRVRTWMAAREGVSGPRATGTSAGPLWNAAEWRAAS